MSKENRSLLINFGIILLVTALITILYITLIPKSTNDKIFNQVVKLEQVELLASDGEKLIKEKFSAKTGKKEIGVVYRVEIKNGYSLTGDSADSLIELFVGIDNDEMVFVEVGTLNQSTWVIKGVKAFVKDNYKNITQEAAFEMELYDVADVTAGATAQDSIGEIKDAVIYVLNFHNGVIEDDPYLEFFDVGYKMEVDNTFIPTLITLNKKVVTLNNEIIGFVYTTTASGVYDDGKEGSVTMEFILDQDNLLKGYLQVEYNHSPSFYRHVKKYLSGFIDTDIALYELIEADIDGVTGATNSVRVFGAMLLDLRTIVTGEAPAINPYDVFFGEGHVLKDDATFVPTLFSLNRKIATKNGVIIGYVYTSTGEGVYVGVKEGLVTMEFIIGADNMFKGYIKGLYEHTEGFYKHVEKYLDDLIDNDITEYVLYDKDVDGPAGATNTVGIISKLLVDVRELVIAENDKNDIYLQLFGEGYIITIDTDFVPTDTVLIRSIVSINNKNVGYIYTTTVEGIYRGDSKGVISLQFVTDLDDLLLGYLELEYTHTTSERYHGKVVEYLDALIDSDLKAYVAYDKDVDTIAGVTNSLTLLSTVLLEIKEIATTYNLKHFTYVELFGNDFTVFEDTDFVVTEFVLNRKIVTVNNLIVGYIYTISADGIYRGTSTGVITFELILNPDDHILDYYEVEYNHSSGSYKNRVIGYLEGLIGTDIKHLNSFDMEVDGIAGSTNTLTLLSIMLIELKTVAIRENDKHDTYVGLFSDKYLISNDIDFVPGEFVLNRKIVKVDGINVAYIYNLTADGIYRGTSTGVISLELIVSPADLLLAYIELEYTHTASPSFKGKVLPYLESLIGSDLKAYVAFDKDVDNISGVTNSLMLISGMLLELGEVLKWKNNIENLSLGHPY